MLVVLTPDIRLVVLAERMQVVFAGHIAEGDLIALSFQDPVLRAVRSATVKRLCIRTYLILILAVGNLGENLIVI